LWSGCPRCLPLSRVELVVVPQQQEEFDHVRISTAKDRPEANARTKVDLEATADELTSLYRALGTTSAELPASDDGNPEDGDCLLSGIEISRVPGSLLRMSVDWDRRVLRIAGGDRETRSFAANVLDIAQETPVGSRQHFDYFRDHFYLDPETASLVVRLT
jgi:hypothetical protein